MLLTQTALTKEPELRIRQILIALATLVLSMTLLTPANGAETLGFSMQPEYSTDATNNLSRNNKLWLVIQPGKSGTRNVRISSDSAINQRIHLQLGGQSVINGELGFDPEASTKAKDWATFSKNDFILKPKEVVQIAMKISVPSDAALEVLQPALQVQASAVRTSDAQIKMPTAMQIVQPMFLGVGTDEMFVTQFSIEDVYGETNLEGRALVVKINNTGKTPISIEGDLQLSNLTFAGPTIGPFKFYTNTIMPGQTGYGRLVADSQITEEKWRIKINARMGNIIETREFEKDIRYTGVNPIWIILISVAGILLSLVVAFISLRILRRPKAIKADATQDVFAPTAPSRTPATNIPRKQNQNIVILFFIYAGKELRKKLTSKNLN
jgi:hypothetical protein